MTRSELTDVRCREHADFVRREFDREEQSWQTCHDDIEQDLTAHRLRVQSIADQRFQECNMLRTDLDAAISNGRVPTFRESFNFLIFVSSSVIVTSILFLDFELWIRTS